VVHVACALERFEIGSEQLEAVALGALALEGIEAEAAQIAERGSHTYRLPFGS
jgi:hypothetical protein